MVQVRMDNNLLSLQLANARTQCCRLCSKFLKIELFNPSTKAMQYKYLCSDCETKTKQDQVTISSAAFFALRMPICLRPGCEIQTGSRWQRESQAPATRRCTKQVSFRAHTPNREISCCPDCAIESTSASRGIDCGFTFGRV